MTSRVWPTTSPSSSRANTSSVRLPSRPPSRRFGEGESGRIDGDERAHEVALRRVVAEQRGEPHVQRAGRERRQRGREQRVGRWRRGRRVRVGRAEAVPARPHLEVLALHADLDLVLLRPDARRDRGVEADQVVAARVRPDAGEAAGQVVAVDHGEAARLLRRGTRATPASRTAPSTPRNWPAPPWPYWCRCSSGRTVIRSAVNVSRSDRVHEPPRIDGVDDDAAPVGGVDDVVDVGQGVVQPVVWRGRGRNPPTRTPPSCVPAAPGCRARRTPGRRASLRA